LNKHHQRRFELVMTKLNKDNLPLLSAVYLLTADRKLWIQAQRHIGKNRINFDQIKPFDCSEYGYPIYCAAKDVYLNTKHFTLHDLADHRLIPNDLFELLYTALIIKRKGINALAKSNMGEE
jgi:hypothetical protein